MQASLGTNLIAYRGLLRHFQGVPGVCFVLVQIPTYPPTLLTPLSRPSLRHKVGTFRGKQEAALEKQ